MKRAIVSLLAVFSILINSCIPIYADEPTVNESNRLIYNIVKLEDMEYVLEGARVNFDYTFKMHIVLEKLNRITNTFEGEFYTSDGHTFSEHIRGSFNGTDLAFDLKNFSRDFRFDYFGFNSEQKIISYNELQSSKSQITDNCIIDYN